jgi:hypothetical protein
MAAKLPETTVPPPISKVIRPLRLVVGVWVSTYTAAPVGEPLRRLTFTPRLLFLKRLLSISNSTA